MFIRCLVDYLVDYAVEQSEHNNWARYVEPHPNFEAFDPPCYNEYMASRPHLQKRKRDDEFEVTLKIKAPKHTKLNNVHVDKDMAWFSSGENYPGSPYFYSKSVLCEGRDCRGCLQNNCNYI